MRISDWSSDVCSSDLRGLNGRARNRQIAVRIGRGERSARWLSIAPKLTKLTVRPGARRSEEHTSELQSLMRISYAVFCLKKKTQSNIILSYNYHHRCAPPVNQT